MARSKLSEQEQQQIVSTYRGSAATAVELAEQFQVSISTISRVLKENIAADEYQLLVNRKRSAARRKDSGEEEIAESAPPTPDLLPGNPPAAPVEAPVATPAAPAPSRSRTRRRSSSLKEAEAQQQILPLEPESLSPPPSTEPIAAADSEAPNPTDDDEGETAEELPAEELELVAELQEDLEDVGEDDEDETDEDSDLEDEEDEEEDPDYFLEDGPEEDSLADSGYPFQVLPLEDLIPPETCYAVVDRYQELATRPLKEFFNLDSLPSQAEGIDSANTLPIFDNHRVARRFSEMSRRGSNTYPPYRVIQFSGHILEAVRTQLQNKGITHLLLDGQIYTL